MFVSVQYFSLPINIYGFKGFNMLFNFFVIFYDRKNGLIHSIIV